MKSLLHMLILLHLLSGGLQAQQQKDYSPPPRLTVMEMDFIPQPDDDVLNVLEVAEGRTFNPTALRNSIFNLYSLGIYSDIRVNWSRVGDGIRLVFRFDEIPLVEGITISGNGPISRREIIDTTELDVNDRYSSNREQDIVRKLGALYEEAGYYAARFTVLSMINLENNNVRLEIQISPGEPTPLRSLKVENIPIFSTEQILASFSQIGIDRKFIESTFRQEMDQIDEFYNRNNYLAADIRIKRIDYDSVDNAIDVVLGINAGPQFKLSVQPEEPQNRQLLSLLPLDDDNIPVENILANGRRQIEQTLRSRGFINAEVTVDWSITDLGELAVDLDIDRGTAFHVGNLTISGIPQELLGELRPRLFLSKKGFFNRPAYSEATLNQDLQRIERYLQENGYTEARATSTVSELNSDSPGVEVAIAVDSGPPSIIAGMAFSGNQSFGAQQLQEQFSARGGDRYSRGLGADLVQRLHSFYDLNGYWQAEVNLEISGDGPEKLLTFNIHEGELATVKKIIIAGNDITNRGTIMRALELQEGEPYSRQKIIESQSNLYGLDSFERVLIESLNSQTAGQDRRISVEVIEQDPYSVLFGFGFDTEEKIRFSFGVSNDNIYGRSLRAGFSSRVSDLEQRYQISLGHPDLWGVFNDLTLRLFYEEIAREGFQARKKGILTDTSGYTWWGWDVIGRYQYRWIDLFNVQPGVEINRFEQPIRLHSFSGIFSRDRRNDPFEPTRGSFSTAILQLAPDVPGSETAFFSADAQHSRYYSLFNNLVLAANARAGFIEPFGENTIPISERFFIGGNNSLRAFPLDSVGPQFLGSQGEFFPAGGNVIFNGNLELRFPFIIEISGATFYDTGNVFSSFSEFEIAEFEHVVGIGLRLATPLGPLRFDYGVSLRGENEQLFVTFGHAF